MTKVARNECHDTCIEATKLAYERACKALGYTKANREADEVIDFLGVTAEGTRAGRLAPFYPSAMTEAVDHAARLARKHPEALLSTGEQALLDLLLRKVAS